MIWVFALHFVCKGAWLGEQYAVGGIPMWGSAIVFAVFIHNAVRMEVFASRRIQYAEIVAAPWRKSRTVGIQFAKEIVKVSKKVEHALMGKQLQYFFIGVVAVIFCAVYLTYEGHGIVEMSTIIIYKW